ncbi:MAG: putative ABC transporter permease subunit [Longimicrobiales bacterium]
MSIVAAGRRGGFGIFNLLLPKFRMARRRMREGSTAGRALLLGSVGLIFWLMLFGIIFRMLRYFKATPGIGDILAVKLLGLILLAFLSVLLLSNIITALTSFFLARDLELLSAAPLDPLQVYGARLIETMVHSSWMVVLVLVPVLSAYGIAYGLSATYLTVALSVLLAYLVLPAVVGTAITLALVNIFPARRARDLLALIALLGAAALIVLLRLLRPEQLARPEGFRDLVDFVAALNTPSSVWLPSEWAAEAITAPLGLRYLQGDFFPLLLLASTAAAFLVLGAWLHERLYSQGFSRAQEGAERRNPEALGPALLERTLAMVPITTRSLMAKDIRTFFRDTTQWSQLILLAVLVVIYVYNIKVLPLWTGERVSFFLINVVSFLNLGLAGFVLAAIAARFLYPAISLEGRTLWLLRSSPLNLRSLVWSKYWVGITPLLVLAVALTAGTNYILRVGSFMMVLSLVSIIMITFAIASLALGFGASFPRFETDNAAEISTGFGGLLFMMSSVAYLGAVVMLEAWPVYALLETRARGQPLSSAHVGGLVVGLGLAVALSVALIVMPLRAARERIELMER